MYARSVFKRKVRLLVYVFFVSFKDKESSNTQLSKTPATVKSPDSEQPTYLLEAGKKTAVTPLDINRFQSKAFQAVISHHIGKTTPLAQGGVPQKEPSLHLDTPSKFLSKDKLFKPSFDVKVIIFLVCRASRVKDVHKIKNSTETCVYPFFMLLTYRLPFLMKPGKLALFYLYLFLANDLWSKFID